MLDRNIADQGRYPAVNVLSSVSRLANSIWSEDQRKLIVMLRALIAQYEDTRDLRLMGATSAAPTANSTRLSTSCPALRHPEADASRSGKPRRLHRDRPRLVRSQASANGAHPAAAIVRLWSLSGNPGQCFRRDERRKALLVVAAHVFLGDIAELLDQHFLHHRPSEPLVDVVLRAGSRTSADPSS